MKHVLSFIGDSTFKRFSHDWFLDNFTLSEQNEAQAATPVLRKQIYSSKGEKSKLIGEKCVESISSNTLSNACSKCRKKKYSPMFAFSAIWIWSGKTDRKRPHECWVSGSFLQSDTRVKNVNFTDFIFAEKI